MALSPDNGILTSPSFLQSVLTSNVEAELSELHVGVKELEKNIQLLSAQVHEDLTGRYIKFDKFDIANDEYLHTAKKLIQDLEDISFRITDGQNQADDENSTQEFQSLHDALLKSKNAVLLTYQLLSIDCALKSLTEIMEKNNFLEAAVCYSKIPPMFDEISGCDSYLNALKKECGIRFKMLNVYLNCQWRKIVLWHETDKSLEKKSVSLKVLKDDKLSLTDTLSALFYAGTLKSTLSIFGKSLLQLVLFPILTKITNVYVTNTTTMKGSMGCVQISVEIRVSKEKPSLSMVLTNLEEVFKFVCEEMGVELGSGVTSLTTLGALVSKEFSKMFLKECLTGSSENSPKDDRVPDVFDELRDLVSYLTQFGFLQCDYLTQYVEKLMKSSDENNAFWECERLMEKARFIIKGDINETLSMQQGSMNGSYRNHQNGSTQSVDQKSLEERPRGLSIVFPTCSVSKWIVDFVELLQEILTIDNEGDCSNQRRELLKTARRIVELYAACVPLRHCGVVEFPPSSIALFYNNTMFLAHQLIVMEFVAAEENHSANHEVTSIDLIQHLRSIAVSSLLRQVQKQRASIVEKIKEIDLLDLNDLGIKVKQCILQMDQLSLAWKGVLPAPNYAKAMGGILDSCLDEFIKLFYNVSRIPENTARSIKLVFKDFALRIPLLFEEQGNVRAIVSRLKRFEALIDILESSLTEIKTKWTNGTLAREFEPQHIQRAEQLAQLLKRL